MARKQGAWGIEVGANAIKAIRLVREDESIVVDDWDVLPFKKILTTPDLNVDEAIRVNLDKFVTQHKFKKDEVVVSVPGNAAFARFAKLPPVDPKRIRDIVKFEAVQQIPFPIDQVEWDYQVFASEDSPDVEVGIFAITKERVQHYLSNYRVVNMKIDAITLSPLAVYNAMCFDEELDAESPGVIYMDIGTSSTDVIIAEQDQIWLRTLPIGGNHFTEALVKAFKLSFPKAEKLKREAGTSKYARQIFQAMRPVFTDLVQEIQRSLGYYQSMNRDSQLEKLVGFGSTFRLPGMIKFLKQQLQLEVVRPDGFKRISVEGADGADFADHAMNLATAYGLALQGMDEERVNANLLPNHIVKQRLWKAKQPWIAASAALLAVAVGASYVKLLQSKSAYEQSYRNKSTAIQQVVRQAESLRNEWSTLTGEDPRLRVENLRRVLDYRDVWPKLMYDITLAAESLGPQAVLLSSDWDKVSQIPRNQRRRLYVEDLSVEYDFSVEAAGGGPGPGRGGSRDVRVNRAQSMTLEEIWGGRERLPDSESAAQTPARNAGATQPPSFIVRIEGTTPLRNAPRELADTVIQWLTENAERKDRPYEIVVGDDALRRVEPLSNVEDRNVSRSPRSTDGGGGGGGGGGTFGATSRFGNVGDGGGRDDSAGGGGRNERTQQLGRDRIFPSRPGEDESKADDWLFEIRFRVRLLRPDDSRLQEVVRQGEQVTQADDPAGPGAGGGGAPEAEVDSRGDAREASS